jgi:hypothetical protein
MTDLPIQDLTPPDEFPLVEVADEADEETLVVGGMRGTIDLKNGGKVTIIASQQLGWHGFSLTNVKGKVTRFALSDEALTAMVNLRTLIEEKEREAAERAPEAA